MKAFTLKKPGMNILATSGIAMVVALATSDAWSACSYTVTNNWGSGFTAEISITNNTNQSVSNWSVSWQESGARVIGAWNATLGGSNPYTATPANWNGPLAPGASASFGFQANGTAGAPKVNGTLCGTTGASSVSSTRSSTPISSSSSSIANSSRSSSPASSSRSSSSAPAAESSWLFEENAVGFCSYSGIIDTKHAGYTGSGFVDTENALGAQILWSLSAASAKTYSAEIRFANGGATARRATLVVNDSNIKTLDFPTNSNWTQWQTVNVDVPLKVGANSIKLVAETADGLANIDSLRITGNGINPAACPSTPTEPTTGTDCNSITNQPILRVAADGSGQYRSVQAALNTLSNSNTTPTQIRIKPGTYREKILVTKPFVTFCGETGKTNSTILTYNDNANTPNGSGGTLGTYGSATVSIKVNDVSLENITIENTYGVGSQAVALLAQGQRLQFRTCRLLGNQDTLYVHSGTQYYRNCYIQGTVDFIFGAATAVFDNATLHSVGHGTALTAPSTEQNVPYGLVFLGGKVTAASSVSKGTVALGRNWRPYGAATYIRTELGQHISPVGWVRMSENVLETARFSEYQTTGAGANPGARAPQSRQLTAAQAATYTINNIFGSWTPSYSK